MQELGEPDYRARQLFEAVYAQRVTDLGGITTLPQSLRAAMQQSGYSVGSPRIDQRFQSVDGTIRYLIGFADGQSVETVWMPEGDGAEDDESVPASILPVAPQELIAIKTSSVVGRPSSANTQEPETARNRDDEGANGQQPMANGTKANDQRPATNDRSWSRATICVSSQVGCAVDCQFCMTALLGVKRNLTAGEIVGQILAVLADRGVDLERDRINLVFMGQGEPFLNYANFMKAVQLLVEGVGIPESRMTVSTAGIVPRIYDFGQEPVRPKLAISLNAPNDEIRVRIMPINRKWNLEKLLAAARDFPLRARERLTFEYVLLDGVNDAVDDARQVVELIRGLRVKVNLIALNPGPDIPFRTPQTDRVAAFQKTLIDAGIPAFVRRPRGRDIYAACGQLKRMAG